MRAKAIKVKVKNNDLFFAWYNSRYLFEIDKKLFSIGYTQEFGVIHTVTLYYND